MTGVVFFACLGLGGVIVALDHADHGRVTQALTWTIVGCAALLIAVSGWTSH